MPQYVVAVSGGVDSIVLLDMLIHGNVPNSQSLITNSQIIVAHFDHGIRTDSADDAEFVRKVAESYGLQFETRREELGGDCSEETARNRRYVFLRTVAKKYDATIMTAHHADDVIETIAINLIRGTGWRGLAVLDTVGIERPLLDIRKTELAAYAQRHALQWHEDSTNADTRYLRNGLRQKLQALGEDSRQLLQLYRRRQLALRHMISTETESVIGKSPYSRHMLILVPDDIGVELLRAVIVHEIGIGPTRPQLRRALHAAKTLHAGKRYEVAAGASIRFTSTHYIVEHSPKVVS